MRCSTPGTGNPGAFLVGRQGPLGVEGVRAQGLGHPQAVGLWQVGVDLEVLAGGPTCCRPGSTTGPARRRSGGRRGPWPWGASRAPECPCSMRPRVAPGSNCSSNTRRGPVCRAATRVVLEATDPEQRHRVEDVVDAHVAHSLPGCGRGGPPRRGCGSPLRVGGVARRVDDHHRVGRGDLLLDRGEQPVGHVVDRRTTVETARPRPLAVAPGPHRSEVRVAVDRDNRRRAGQAGSGLLQPGEVVVAEVGVDGEQHLCVRRAQQPAHHGPCCTC